MSRTVEGSGGGTQANTAPRCRFEYRIWPGTLPPANVHLQNDWQLETCEARTDVYLLSSFCTRQIVKLRGGVRLEIKSLVETDGMVQSWEVPLATGFPLEIGALEMVDSSLHPARVLNPEARLSPTHLIADLVEKDADIAILNARKSRALFARDGCRAEITHVRVAGQRLMTIGIEDPDADHARRIVRELELDDHPNRDYGDVMRAVAGLDNGTVPSCAPLGEV